MNKKPFHSDNRSDRKPFGSKDEKPFRKSFDNKEEKPFRKSFGSNEDKPSFKKPFNKDGDRPYKKPFGANEDRPFKKSYDKDGDRPFKKSFGNNEDRPFKKSFGGNEDRPFKKSYDKDGDRPFKKSFGGNEDRPFKKSYDKDGDRPFKKSFGGNEDRPFKKSYDKDGDRPFKKSFGGNEDRPFKKSYDKDGDRPFKKSFGGNEDRPFKKSYDKDGDRPFKKSFGGNEDRPFKKSYDKDGDRPFKKSFGGNEDRPFKKSYDKDGDRPFKKSFGGNEDRPFKKSFDKDGDRPFKKSYDKDGDKSFKKPFAKDGDRSFKKPFDKRDGDRTFKKKTDDKDQFGEEKKPNRYANAFGKLDDEELAAHQKKQAEKRAKNEEEDEITFTKELDNKWDEAPVEKVWGRSDIKKSFKKEEGEAGEEGNGGALGGRKRHVHDASTRFKKQFDDENEHEKAYSTRGGKKEEKKLQNDDLDGQSMPLNKFIAHCDICSRRDAVVLIKEGKVTVNGELIIEPGHKVTTEDVVTLNGTKLQVQKNLVYILMNKPKGFITTTDDPKGRRTVMEMVENVIDERVFPVGRLDRNTTGLLLLTNDGELTQKLSHPKHEIKKVYKATLDRNLSKEDFEKIKKGVVLEDGLAPVDQLEYLDDKNEIGLEIHSGKNRIVRRIFESLGYVVEKLDRVMYAGLTKKNVMRGKWRFLTKQEVINLKHIQ